MGRLRWFLRTVYNRFYKIDDESKSNDENKLKNYKRAEELLSKILGGKESKSHYSFKVSPLNSREKLETVEDLDRLKLNFRNQNYPHDKVLPIIGIRFKLEILRINGKLKENEYKGYDRIVIAATMITLAYLGVGKAASRGFGRFIPSKLGSSNNKSYEIKLYDDPDLKDVYESILNGDPLKAFKSFYNLIRKSYGSGDEADWRESWVPLSPSIDGEESIKVINCPMGGLDIIKVMNIIFKSVQKASFKRYVFNINTTSPGPFIHTWLLGLPRSAKRSDHRPNYSYQSNQGQIEYLGYLKLLSDNKYDNNVRRQSAYIISPVLLPNGKFKICIIPFLSLKDHENVLEFLIHVGKHNNDWNSQVDKDNVTIHIVRLIKTVGKNKTLNESDLKDSYKGKELELAKSKQDYTLVSLDKMMINYIKGLTINIENLCKENINSKGSMDREKETTYKKNSGPDIYRKPIGRGENLRQKTGFYHH